MARIFTNGFELQSLPTSTWETLILNNPASADTDFTLTADVADLTNYKDGDVVSCRVYQRAI